MFKTRRNRTLPKSGPCPTSAAESEVGHLNTEATPCPLCAPIANREAHKLPCQRPFTSYLVLSSLVTSIMDLYRLPIGPARTPTGGFPERIRHLVPCDHVLGFLPQRITGPKTVVSVPGIQTGSVNGTAYFWKRDIRPAVPARRVPYNTRGGVKHQGACGPPSGRGVYDSA